MIDCGATDGSTLITASDQSVIMRAGTAVRGMRMWPSRQTAVLPGTTSGTFGTSTAGNGLGLYSAGASAALSAAGTAPSAGMAAMPLCVVFGRRPN